MSEARPPLPPDNSPAAGLDATRPLGGRPPPRAVTRLEWTAGKPLSGRYVMVDKLGEGGMGTVYLVEDLLLRRRVALKTLFAEDAFEPADIERFRKEVALAHSINHPNVARTYDLGEEGGVHFLSMEHLRGETLMGRIRRGPVLTSKEVREVAVPLCRGLAAAHRSGVVHRDLKPANVMLVPDSRKAVIMDFGIARSMGETMGEEVTLSRPRVGATVWDVTSAGLGTPAYMAPEQWDSASGDQRTDIYALGVILFVCLTGQAPYAADTPTELGDRHRQSPVPDVHALATGVDRDLAALIRKCLAKRPEDRPQSVDELLELLERGERRRRFALQLSTVLLSSAAVLGLLGWSVYAVAEQAVLQEMRPALSRLAELVAHDIDPADMDRVRTPADIDTAPFRRVHAIMERYHRENPEIRYFYTMRPGASRGLYHYVVDEQPRDRDLNGDGQIRNTATFFEEGTPPGEFYDGRDMPAMAATVDTGRPHTDQDFARDGLEITLSGYAAVPIGEKPARYFVAVDVTNDQLSRLRLALTGLLGLAELGLCVAFSFLLAPGRQHRRALAAWARNRAQPHT